MSAPIRNVIKTFTVNSETVSYFPVLSGSHKYLHTWKGVVPFPALVYCMYIRFVLCVAHASSSL